MSGSFGSIGSCGFKDTLGRILEMNRLSKSVCDERAYEHNLVPTSTCRWISYFRSTSKILHETNEKMKNGTQLKPILFIKPKQIPDVTSNYKHSSRPNPTSLSSTLQHYIESNSPSQGLKIHAHILKIGFRPNTNISIKLLILYIRSGFLTYARQVFDQMPKPTTSSYNSIISAYFRQGQTEKSLSLIRKLAYSNGKFDGFTFSMSLKLSTTLMCPNLGKQIHCQIAKSNIELDDVLFTALVDNYAKNGRIDYARKVYDKMSEQNIICSTAMISGYMKEGLLKNAEEIFQNTTEKDIVVFNAMIEGYSTTIETAYRSLEVYIDMQRLNFRPTISTFASVIGACSVLSASEFGQQVHCQLIKTDILSDVRSSSALVDMYSKCGRIEDARRIFDSMPEKNVFSWTSMIDGYGKNGNPDEALEIFDEMRNEQKVEPNYVTFLSALSACGHAGLISRGQGIFNSMKRDYSLKPRMEHYACMVDLLGRAGSLNHALEFIKKMPERPGSDVWGALLGACRLHGHVKMADLAANELFKLSIHERPGAYIALSNTFAAAGKWEGVCEVRELMKERGISKDVGCSWVGTDRGLCGFHVGQKKW
ncbi:tetratricopeptide repeat (TPR)-like superfamily protein [Tasmannia lanceolata]|uniref:tetratricopeptide repeat (TPR)-like superfamily protein n=1 Tax=Tasmannia lanceolata TaxID=3420 RepID=UPI0040648690